MQLRPYQERAIADAREIVRAGFKRALIVAPTGAGKTIIACEMIRSAVARGSRVLFLAHRRELIAQTSQKLAGCDIQHGVIMAGAPAAPQSPVQLASVQTLVRRECPPADLVFVDEAHHCTTKNTYGDLLEKYLGRVIIGLTATPWRLDGAGLEDVFPMHVLVARPHELRDEGYLVPLVGREYVRVDTRGVAVRSGDFARDELAERAKRIVGPVVDDWLAHASARLTTAFCVNVAHAEWLRDEFLRRGIDAVALSYLSPVKEREEVLRRFRAGEARVLCNVDIVTEGFDLPAMSCALLCRPTLSTGLYIQMAGRILRPAEGKTDARIHDHAGLVRAHGHPYLASRDYSPCAQEKKKRAAYESEGDDELDEIDALARKQDDPAERHAEGVGRELSGPTPDETARQRRWAGKSPEEKRDFYARMVEKHRGPRKAAGVYFWASGGTEWPPVAWRVEHGDVLTGKLKHVYKKELKNAS